MKRAMRSIAAIILAGMLPSCAALSVNALPQPGKTYSDGHQIVIEFENALNLPDRARVVLDGTTVGVVTSVVATSRYAEVTARIDPHVSVPSNIHPVLQQATVLGDIYVAFERPETDDQAVPILGLGARIPLAQTATPAPLESTIANLAMFVSSGSIQRIQNTMIRLNRMQPAGDGALRNLVARVSADINDLGQNIDLVDHWLEGLAGTAEVMHDRIPSFAYWFSPKGMTAFDRMTQLAKYVGTLFPSLGSVYGGGYWLVPLLNSVGNGLGALQHSKWAFQDEYPAWQHLLTDYFLPQDKYPAINITSIVGPDGHELSGNVQDVLRMLGATP